MASEIERAGDLTRVNAELDALVQEAAQLTQDLNTSSGHDLVPSGGQTPDATKAALVAQRGRIESVRRAIAAKQAEQKNLLERQQQRLYEIMEPLKTMAQRLQEGLDAINLYMGFDQDITVLAEGEPAPATEPIRVRQLVLSMDEECAVAAETGGIDAVGIEQFDQWLLEDPRHLQQVLPELRGVVALVPRRTERDYGDPWMSAQMKQANTMTYFLVRNGANLFRICAEFRVGEHLIPRSDEFTSMFTERRYDFKTGEDKSVQLDPGSPGWSQAEAKADARQRHYMKIALILQGLVDRTEVFHPLPAAQVSLLHPDSYDAGYVQVIADGERAIGTGQETFDQWQTRLNGQLRVGMRIIGAFNSESFRHSNENSDSQRYGHSRLYPSNAERPPSGAIYELTQRVSDQQLYSEARDGLAFNYERTEEVWISGRGWRGRDELRRPKTRARCVIYPSDNFIIAFDLAEAADMERFLQARTERRNYIYMFPVLKAAIRAKRQEDTQEQPFRQMLAGQLALRNQVTIPDAEQVVPDLVAWYKYANRHHRPLVGGPEHKAVEQIVAEHRRRLTHHDIAAKKAGTLPVLRQRHQDAVLIGRKRNGRLVVLLAANDGQIFVHRLEYLTTNLDEPASRTDWIAPGPEVARYTVLWQAERWATWRQGVSRADYLSGPEIQQTAASLAQDSETAFLVSFSAAKRTFTVWEMSERPEYSQDRPLTQRHHDVEVEATRQRWERKAGRIALHRGGSNNYSVRWDRSRFPWGDKHGQYDWEKDTVIWRDETKINSIFECRAQYEKFLKLERKLDSVARAIGMSIRQQWLERAEQTAKAEYIERYGDLSTWDDRQQQIHFPYTINTLHETDPRSGDVGVFVLYLVEAGLTVKGVTVAQARDKLQTTLGRPFKLPDDILDLKLA